MCRSEGHREGVGPEVEGVPGVAGLGGAEAGQGAPIREQLLHDPAPVLQRPVDAPGRDHEGGVFDRGEDILIVLFPTGSATARRPFGSVER